MAVDYEALLIIQTEFRKIAEALKNVEVKNLNDINVSNLDEVKAHLRNELRPVILAINSLSKVMGKVSVNANPKLNYEIKIPEVIKLADFDVLKKSIADLAAILKGKEFSPTIKVNVPDVIVPDIKIPEIKIPDIIVPEPKITVNPASLNLDLSELLDALEPLKYLSNKASNPISVRISDGQKFIKALQTVADKAGQVVHAFATSNGMSASDYKQVSKELEKAKTATNTFAAVGVASSVVSAAKGRLSIILINDSDTVVYLAKGDTAVVGSGIRLNASGGAATIEDWDGAIAAISTGAAKNLCICETVQ